MSRYPRVCFIAGTLGPGGAERQLYEQCCILRDAGATPLVLSLTTGEVWADRLGAAGIDVVWVGRRAGRLARLWRVIGELRRRRVDVVQAGHAMVNLYAVGAGLALRRPSIGALRTTPDRVLADLGRLGRPALRLPRRLAGNSRANLAAAVSLGVDPERIRYVPNVIDLDRFTPTAVPDEDRVDIVFVGRLAPEKRIDVLLDALHLLRGRGVRPSTVIVGSGPDEDRLRARVEQLGLDDLVRFTGFEPEPRPWYHRGRMLVLPSEREGTPNVVLEAMACARPVVATTVGSVPELVGDRRTGCLVPVGDVDALADAIAFVLEDGERAEVMGIAGRGAVAAGHDRQAAAAALDELYEGMGPWGPPCAA